MQGLGVARLGRQDLLIQGARLVQPSGLVQALGAGEQGCGPDRRPWASSSRATAAVSFLAKGTCRNSSGPWALEAGPSTPVITNCACGKARPSMPMNGIEPPSPIMAAGAPNAALDASPSAVSSQGANGGDSQPEPGVSV